MVTDSKKIKSLILTLEKPVKLFLSREELPDKPLKIDDVKTTRPSFPPWPVCADILLNSQSRIFVGVTYPVHEDSKDFVRDLSTSMSNEVVRYNDLSLEKLIKPYADDESNIHRLEIMWADINVDTVESAQLDSVFWYYSSNQPRKTQVLAFGLTDIDKVLEEYGLIFPVNILFPQFVPEFID